jgi:pre-rRNA-processing protein TSR3
LNCVEALAAAFCICGISIFEVLMVGHTEWGEQLLEGFSWGHAFFEVNGGLLERYAQCKDAEDVTKVQEAWLERLEKEWTDNRKVVEGEDEWAGGNPNQIASYGTDDEEDEEDEPHQLEDDDEEESHEESQEEGDEEEEGKEEKEGIRK